MKKNKKISLLIAFMLLVIAVFAFATVAFSASDSAFEKQLRSFPESYRPYLRALHEKYPNWSFEPFYTGLDWDEVIDNEHNDYALVYNPDAARIFKSLDSDDYDAEEDKFYYKDGSFVAASRIAVEYFMDPRNFLDIGGIFQFENLDFNSYYTTDTVEAVLKNSFMSKAKMSWVNSKGKKYTSNKTYAQAIFEAGKKYDINPCFLASKILNEVGSQGSTSVTGTNKKYPGIYNFYNIGATDGAGAVERGLLWASGSGEGRTTYSRPWTTPEKSILGGAEFLAEEYIAAGQYTGYLQRFNVNSDSDYKLYTHQYMSNLTGALSQGYSTYKSYRDLGILDKKLSFSIPVYENMSNADGSGRLAGAESVYQYGTASADYRYVRTGPSVDNDIVTTKSGDKVYLKKGADVQILGKTDTDAYYYEEILTYPYWYRVSFEFDGKKYEGYVPASRISIETTVYVAKGETDIALSKSKSVKPHIVSSDPSKVKIIDGDTVNFTKKGSVKLYIYSSCGLFEEILFKVGSYSSYYPKSVSAKVSGDKVTVSSAKHEDAKGYGYTLSDMSGVMIEPDFTTKTSRSFDDLSAGSVYDVFVQNKYSTNKLSKAVQVPVVIKPSKVTGFDFIKDSSAVCHLSWEAVNDATGYQLASYDEKTKKYTKVVTVAFGTNSYTLSAAQAEKADKYAVRAYSKYDGEIAYGSYSELISLSSKAPTPSAVKITNKTTGGFTVEWTGNKACSGYEVYVATPEKPEPYYYKTVTGTSLKMSGYKKLTLRKYKIRSFINTDNGKVYSDFTSLVTALTLPQKVQKLTLKPTSTTITASWSKHTDADYYRLYYKKDGGKYKSVKVNDTSYTLKSLSNYTDYVFYVTAVSVREGASSEGQPCTEVKARTLPAVPKNLKVTYQGYNHIDLSWDQNPTLDSYTVYCYNSSGKLVTSATTKQNSVRISGLSRTTAYKFKIKGNKTEGKTTVGSDYSAEISSETVIPVVTGFKTSSVTKTSFKLSWNKLEGAESYTVYYRKDGSYKKLKTTKKTYYTVKAVPESSKGYFYVIATFGTGDKAVKSEKSKIFTASVKPATVTGITVDASATSAVIKWKKVNNATGYKIYILKNGKYVTKKTVKKGKTTSATITGLKDCSDITISVVAYISSTVGKAYGDHSAKSFYTKPKNITAITQSNKTDTSYTLSWKKPSDAVNRYYLYRYNDKKGKYERIAVTKKTSYTVNKLTPGTTQRYTVMAALSKDGKVVSKSDRVCNFECSTSLPQVIKLKVESASETSLVLKWRKLDGATSYQVYRYNTKKKKFELYKEVTKNTVTVSKLSSGKEYTFRVRAMKKAKKVTYDGIYSSNLKAKTK